MATTSEHELAELKRELAELAKQAERPAGEISGKRAGRAKGAQATSYSQSDLLG